MMKSEVLIMFGIVPYARKNNQLTKNDLWGFNNLWDDFFTTPFVNRVNYLTTQIHTDIKETEKDYILEAELPGIKKEDIQLDLRDNVLTIQVVQNEEKNEEKNGYICRERRIGSMSRSFRVENIKNEDVKASYTDGVLKLVLPKAEPGQRKTSIDIE
jgi:HSP20 family protein